jgi:hypothetical protein
MLLPALAAAKKAAQKTKAKLEVTDLVNAITAYDTDYGRFPVTSDEKKAAYLLGNNDFTTGMVKNPVPSNPNLIWLPGASGNSYDNNSNVVAILMDLEKYPSGTVTSNNGHVYNPKSAKYLSAKLSGYDPTSTDPNPPGGVDNTGIYRDPWGNPYIITMDTSYDDQCSDLLYSMQKVSQNGNGAAGFNGLSNPNANPNTDNFLYHGKVMVWSAGPDKQFDPTKAANADVNKDNIISW